MNMGVKINEIFADIRTRFSDTNDLKDLNKSCLNYKPTLKMLDRVVSKIDQSTIHSVEFNEEKDIEAWTKSYMESLNFKEEIEKNFKEIANLERMSEETGIDLTELSSCPKELEFEGIFIAIPFDPIVDNSITIVISFLIDIVDVSNLDCYINIDLNLEIIK